jgi:large subunit ribosomal protein L21
MYAVIKTGGKQYRVAKGDKLKVEKLPVEAGSSLDIDDVLMIGDGDNVTIGAPRVDGGKVTATVVSHGRHDKIEIVKFKRRKHHQKRTGHRQDYTEIEITDISA